MGTRNSKWPSLPGLIIDFQLNLLNAIHPRKKKWRKKCHARMYQSSSKGMPSVVVSDKGRVRFGHATKLTYLFKYSFTFDGWPQHHVFKKEPANLHSKLVLSWMRRGISSRILHISWNTSIWRSWTWSSIRWTWKAEAIMWLKNNI